MHVGTNSPVFVMNRVSDGDVIKVNMTSNATCANPVTVVSNPVDLKIDYALCPSHFYMPTGFTPNQDGKNDLLKPSIDGKLVNYRFSIFNRWGQKIFETTDIMKGWDGKVFGTQTDSNVFVWYCTYQFIGQPAESKKGTVVLIR
jgi:gliding motility-associated-like protein